jgi:hypothetical protein
VQSAASLQLILAFEEHVRFGATQVSVRPASGAPCSTQQNCVLTLQVVLPHVTTPGSEHWAPPSTDTHAGVLPLLAPPSPELPASPAPLLPVPELPPSSTVPVPLLTALPLFPPRSTPPLLPPLELPPLLLPELVLLPLEVPPAEGPEVLLQCESRSVVEAANGATQAIQAYVRLIEVLQSGLREHQGSRVRSRADRRRATLKLLR